MYAEERLKSEVLKEAIEKVVKPSQRREMAQRAVAEMGMSSRLACQTFHITLPVNGSDWIHNPWAPRSCPGAPTIFCYKSITYKKIDSPCLTNLPLHHAHTFTQA